MCCALPLPFLNDFDTFAGLIWFLLFFGGAILPSLTGVMLNTVNINQKTTANALANLCYNLFGYLPAPFIYGMIYDAGDGGNSRYSLGMLCFWTIPTISSFLIATYMIIKQDLFNWKEEEAKNQKELKEMRKEL